MTERMKTISARYAQEAREAYIALFGLTDEKIDEVLKSVDYGRIFPEVWQEGQEEELSRKISKICNIDEEESDKIIVLLLNVLRGLSMKGFISNQASDLEKLGFKQPDVKRFRRIARILKKQKTAKEIMKIDSWRELSEEVLPGIDILEYSYDIRCKIEKGKVEEYIPMVLIKLKATSPEGGVPKEIVFQTSIGALRHLARGFNTMYKEARLLRKYGVRPKRGKK